MTRLAVSSDAVVSEQCGPPCERRVAGVTLLRGREVVDRLTARSYTVMAVTARARLYAGMIETRWRPRGAGMAVLARVVRRDVVRALAPGDRAVVT